MVSFILAWSVGHYPYSNKPGAKWIASGDSCTQHGAAKKWLFGNIKTTSNSYFIFNKDQVAMVWIIARLLHITRIKMTLNLPSGHCNICHNTSAAAEHHSLPLTSLSTNEMLLSGNSWPPRLTAKLLNSRIFSANETASNEQLQTKQDMWKQPKNM